MTTSRYTIPSLNDDASYREMLRSAIAEMLRDLETGEYSRAASIGQMAILLNAGGSDSPAALAHLAIAAAAAEDTGAAGEDTHG